MKKALLFLSTIVFLSLAACESGTDIAPEDETSSEGKVTYNGDIKSILTSKCSPCHVSGGNESKWDNFASTKAKASGIVNRIEREEGSGGFMPRNGSKLPAADINKIKQWITDGSLEK